ncbi:MAG: hypothetical protein ACRDO1_14605 [Nocardioidaceae bacterium]
MGWGSAPASGPESKSGRTWQTIAEETGEVRSFPSYAAAKRALGTEPGTEIHHIVEQSQTNPSRSGFSVERVNPTDNMVRLPTPAHRQITARYNRNVRFANIRLRDTLNGRSWDDQHRFGSRVIDETLKDSDGR